MSIVTGRSVVRLLVLAVLAALVLSAAAGAANIRISSGTSDSTFFGNSIGVDFRDGRLVAAWADNSPELGGNPDLPSLDIAFGAVSGGVAEANVNVTRSPLSQFGVSLAVDPTDPDRLLLAAVEATGSTPSSLRALSSDGGATWTTAGGMPGNFGGFPPQVAFDGFGNAFIALIHDPNFGNPRVELFLSSDSGATFSPVALPDPPGLETNVSVAAGFGSVWLAFQSVDGGSVRVDTLSAPVLGRGAVGEFTAATLPGSGDGRTPDVALGPGGGAFVTYSTGLFTQAPAVVVQVDADGRGAAPFAAPVRVANVPGYPHLSRPTIAVDTAGGRAYVVYEDRQEGAGPEDVLLNFSDDGSSWSAAIRVNDAVASRDRLLPNVAADPISGAVGVAWYDFRSGAAQLFGEVRAAVQHPAEPRAPIDLSATGVSRSQIDLRWTDTSTNETSFQIERRTGNPFETPPIVATLPANTTSYSDTGLPEDSGFGYRVRAVNAAGPSRWSNGAAATTLDTAPAAPTNLVATALSFQRIDLQWDVSDDADGIEIQQSTDGAAWTSLGRGGIAQDAMLFGLSPGTTYFFRVRAFNSGGDSPFSNVASATTFQIPPDPPSGLTATTVSSSRVDLAWRDNSTNEASYEVEQANGQSGFKRIATLPAGATSFAVTGLRARTSYSFRVRGCNTQGCSVYSNTATATTLRR